MFSKILAGFVCILSLALTSAQNQDQKDKKPSDKKDEKEDKKPPEKTEATPLEGTWTVLSVDHIGKKAPPDKSKDPTIFTFKGNKLTIHRGKRALGQGTVKLDPDKKPAQWDYLEAKDVYSPYDIGIYHLQGDTLKLCTSADRKNRPSDFDPKQGQVLVLKKGKP